jgi:hypothetical protein
MYICKTKKNDMTYTAKQIEQAKRNYTFFLKFKTIEDENPQYVGYSVAEQRASYHNNIVSAINAGNKELEKEWKLFFLNEEVKKDKKNAESKAKLTANKDASSDILAPIKSLKKIGEFGKWLNDSKNEFRKEHFSKKYTTASVEAFLKTI